MVLELDFLAVENSQLGQLIPIMCEPVVPGDTFRINTEVMVRMAPMTFPIMQH